MLAPVRLAVALLAAAVTLAGAIPRVLLAAGLLPDVLRPFVFSDVLLVYLRGLSGHQLPYVDTPFEYPPLVALASGIFSRASENAATFVSLWGVLQAVLAAVTAWTLAGAASARTTLWRFALAPQLLLLGAANFDLMAVAFMSLAIILARGRYDIRAGSVVALGTLSKLFPIAAAPVLIARAARPALVALVGSGIIAIGYAAAAVAGQSGATAPLYYLFGIGANFDSAWGLMIRALDATFLIGSQEVIIPITLIGLVVTYLVAVLPLARAPDPAIPFGLAVVTTLIWSRLYSPQYSLWLLPLFVLLPLSRRLFVLLIAGDIIVFTTVYPLTLVHRTPDDASAAMLFALLAFGVILRTVALLATWAALRRLAPRTRAEG